VGTLKLGEILWKPFARTKLDKVERFGAPKVFLAKNKEAPFLSLGLKWGREKSSFQSLKQEVTGELCLKAAMTFGRDTVNHDNLIGREQASNRTKQACHSVPSHL
jgi:hypothetical protein